MAADGLMRAQRRAGAQVDLLATEGSSRALVNEWDKAGINVHLVPPLSRGLRAPAHYFHMIRDSDVVHVHAVWEPIQLGAIRAARTHNKPCILRPCGMLEDWSLRQGSRFKRLYLQIFVRPLFPQLAAVHFTTESENLRTRCLQSGVRRIVRSNGVDLPHQVLGLPRYSEGLKTLLFVGRIHPKKGLLHLVRALRSLPGILLEVVGPEQDRRYAAEVREAALGLNVRFLGHLDHIEVMARMGLADLLVVPSYQENFANVVLEAAAAGTPSLVSEQVGLASELAAEAAGQILPFHPDWSPPQVTASIVRSLRQLAESPGRMRTLSESARVFAESRTWDRIAAEWLEEYTRFLR
jgi:glycosyltransferase involved in cell wall biosynthesis